ncbi:MAG: glycogen/starch synthase [Bacteroidales bacterium]|jgi:starch synthase|nr:glycogen/starch synthase [Bacteroidales bacterium]
MEKPKILFISQEVFPYVKESMLSRLGRYLPQGVLERGKEVRSFTPRYGIISERRNCLHPVLRLSGINLSINDTDHQLTIKVSSIPQARMQIYFIDNDEYFYKRNQFTDKNGNPYPDNDEKAMFFARGTLETVKNLKWKPDIILCSGWFSSLVPMYVKKMYKNNVFFGDAKIITAVFSDGYKGTFRDDFADKLRFDKFTDEDIAPYGKFSYPELMRASIDYSDGVIISEKPSTINELVLKAVKESDKPTLPYSGDTNYVDVYDKFFNKFLQKNK